MVSSTDGNINIKRSIVVTPYLLSHWKVFLATSVLLKQDDIQNPDLTLLLDIFYCSLVLVMLLTKSCSFTISFPNTGTPRVYIAMLSGALVGVLSALEGGSNEYPQSMFLSRNKKNNVYPYKPQV